MVEGPALIALLLLAIAFIAAGIAWLKLHPFMALLLATIGLGLSAGLGADTVLIAMQTGFGNLMSSIGMVVVLGSIIGTILEKSGAALRMADWLLRLTGAGRSALAMSLIGLVVSIPVFCDTGFIILSKLNQALSQRSSVARGTLALALASGLYTTHTLVPPTPGPIAAAANLGAGDYLGAVMLTGLVIAIPTALVALLLAKFFGKSIAVSEPSNHTISSPSELPGLGKTLLPLTLPILLIALASIGKMQHWEGAWVPVLYFAGHPIMALLIGVLAALPLMKRFDQEHLTGWMGEGIQAAGPILIITGAGGALGEIVKATSLKDWVAAWVSGGTMGGSGLLLIAFGMAALLKTAQGSSTSALIITSSILAPLTALAGMDTPMELALLVMAIGGGAMTVSHANDSYFWVVTQFSGIAVKDAYRSYTIITLAQGLCVLALSLLGYSLLD